MACPGANRANPVAGLRRFQLKCTAFGESAHPVCARLVAIDTAAEELKDGQNHCPKCGATDIRHKTGSDLLVCLYCRNEWQGQRVEEEFGFGEGLDELTGTVIASGAQDIAAGRLATSDEVRRDLGL